MTLLRTFNPGAPLSESQAKGLMTALLDPSVEPIQVAATLAVLSHRPLQARELAAFAEVLAQMAAPFPTPPIPILDTCGTGGDALSGVSTPNLSTLAAFLLAHLRVPVVKHGNRAATSVCGSADLLESLGYDLHRMPQQLFEDLHDHHFAFLFAPLYFPVLGRLKDIRQRLGIPTIFNLLGPLLNPARPTYQLLGVSKSELMEPMAGALVQRGVKGAFVVHGLDGDGRGMDEASVEGLTALVQVREGEVQNTVALSPEEMGLSRHPPGSLQIKDREEALRLAKGLMAGKEHPDFRPALADAVALQAGLALLLYRNQPLHTLRENIREAQSVLNVGFSLPFIPLLTAHP